MTLRFADYVEILLRSLYPNADIIVTPEPDGVHLEIYDASYSLHSSIGDERSAMLAVLEQILLETCLAAS